MMKMHHIAYVCNNIEMKAQSLAALCGCAAEGGVIEDAARQVRILLLKTGTGVGIELLEPISEKSPIAAFLQKGGKLYHLCFEVDDLDAHLKSICDGGLARLVGEVAPAPAFGGRRVAFVVTADRDLIEFVESEQASQHAER